MKAADKRISLTLTVESALLDAARLTQNDMIITGKLQIVVDRELARLAHKSNREIEKRPQRKPREVTEATVISIHETIRIVRMLDSELRIVWADCARLAHSVNSTIDGKRYVMIRAVVTDSRPLPIGGRAQLMTISPNDALKYFGSRQVYTDEADAATASMRAIIDAIANGVLQ